MTGDELYLAGKKVRVHWSDSIRKAVCLVVHLVNSSYIKMHILLNDFLGCLEIAIGEFVQCQQILVILYFIHTCILNMHYIVVKKGNNYESWRNLLLFLYIFLSLSVG